MYLRCARGTVLWRYPHDALRVVLSSPVSFLENNSLSYLGFRACVKISGPVRVFLEAGGKLRQLYSPSDGKHELTHRCFRSRKHTAALYMEAEDDYSFKNTKVKLQYDLEPNSVKGGTLRVPDEEEDCRPCSMEELAKAYCQSDLVAKGTVTDVQQNPKMDTAELILRVTKILRYVAQEAEVKLDKITYNNFDFSVKHNACVSQLQNTTNYYRAMKLMRLLRRACVCEYQWYVTRGTASVNL